MKRLRTAKIGGVTYSIYLAADHERVLGAEPLGDSYGLTDHDHQVIVLGEKGLPDRVAGTLLHETLHAAIFESGAYETLKRLIKNPEAVASAEECLVTTLAPTLCEALISIGWTPPGFLTKKGSK